MNQTSMAARTLLALALLATSAFAMAAPAGVQPHSRYRLEVSFPANTVEGVTSQYAVRGCLGNTSPLRLDEHATHGGSVRVRLLDGRGAEVARHNGSRGICTFARYADDYAATSLAQDTQAKAAAGVWTDTDPATVADVTPKPQPSRVGTEVSTQ